jgi:hypothetical protein
MHREVEGDGRSRANWRKYSAEAFATLQIEESEEDAFNMLGSAIVDVVADDPAHTAALFELWKQLVEQRKLS